MSTDIRILRSSSQSMRARADDLDSGQPMVNTESSDPGLYFRLDNGKLMKVGPTHVGSSTPNQSPAAGGEAGNAVGETWVDTSNSSLPLLKVYTPTGWLTVSTKGDKGQKGEQGIKGQKGQTGADSTVQGPKGQKGTDGAGGSTGSKGNKGDQGPQGTKGNKGDQGVGVKGQKGDTGTPDTLNGLLTTLGIGSYADNTTAQGAGLATGDVYYNTSDTKLTTVTA